MMQIVSDLMVAMSHPSCFMIWTVLTCLPVRSLMLFILC